MSTLTNTNILLRHNFVAIPPGKSLVGSEALATILMNLSYYGRALSVEGYTALVKLGPADLATWWCEVETELKDITGANRKMGDFVVYKNFPAEVLSKTDAEYWLPQILMYWGFPNELFTEEVKPRDKMNEQPKATVLKLAKKDTLKDILTSLLKAPARWKSQEMEDTFFLAQTLPVNLAKLAFKENLVTLATVMMTAGKKINITTATDVLRLAAGLSDGDVSLRTKFKFKSFKKPVRKFLLSSLEACSNLDEDAARRPELWKRLLHQLHPGDWKNQFPNAVKVQDDLYNDRLQTFNSLVEEMLTSRDSNVLDLLATRPGEFRRRLVHTLDIFGNKAATAFASKDVLDKLTTAQVVTLRSYLETVNGRDHRVFPPRGNWSKLQVGEARGVGQKYVKTICSALGKVLSERVTKVKVLDIETLNVKLPSNDGEVSPYARGTVFPIPDGIKFIRSASYWKMKARGNVWFDNGWNFFSADWQSMGSVCWTDPKLALGAGVFSGDPTNSKDEEGRACQVIDIYLDKMANLGIRYAVWNVLCFSRVPFSQADEVFAGLQWGENADEGKIFEPSRNQLAFPLTGESLTKYVCLIDLHKREMVYLDANLRGDVSAASRNGKTLEKIMPAFMEYIGSLPSVHDLFRESVDENSETQILYSDKDVELKGEKAYVFKPENKDSKYKPVDINGILA